MRSFTFSFICLIHSTFGLPFPAPQPQFPEFDTSDPATQLAGVATLGATLFAGYNCLTGNCNIRVRPNLGLNYDPKTGRLAPALGANVQVGDKGIVNPSFNVGGQFDPNNGGRIPITPFVGTGVNVGDGQGHVNPALTTNFAVANSQANPQIGGGLNLGNFLLGNPNQLLGGRR